MTSIASSSVVLRIVFAGSLVLSSASGSAPRVQEEGGAPPVAEKDPEIRTATAEELGSLIDEFAAALRAGESDRLAAVLRTMHVHDNAELLECARPALGYEAGKPDQQAAKKQAAELGMESPSEIAALVRERESLVRAAAARLCANLPGKKTNAMLQKALAAKDEPSLHPKAFAAIVDALGRLKCVEAHEAIAREFGQFRDREIMRACTRYFGQVQSKDKGVVRQLCEMLDPPVPGGDEATNPPASYWEERWKQWNWIRRDVAWALKEITGEAFQPADGDHPGESKKALAWVRDNAKKLGLK